MRFAYADPPYIGLARKFYKADPRCAEVDHAELVASLERDFPDGWALSLHSPALRIVLPMCPQETRVMAWVKPFCSFKPGNKVAWAWEPVLVRGGRKRTKGDTVRDWLAESIALRKGLPGAKPEAVCEWILTVLGFQPGDELVDLYPGTGIMGRVASRMSRERQESFA